MFRRAADGRRRTIFDILNREVARLREADFEFNKYLNVLPYFYGNRSPRADPDLWGMIDGLRLEDDISSYAKLYLSTYRPWPSAPGTYSRRWRRRDTISHRRRGGHRGHTRNELLLQEHANILERPVYLSEETENMLLGGAINAAVAAGQYATVTRPWPI